MATPILVPQLGLVEEIVVLEWLQADGAEVSAGEPLVLVETEKTQTEIEAPARGVLRIAVPASPNPITIETILGQVE